MLETVVTEIITRFFGDLIKDFHKEDLHIGVSSMEAEVKNLVFFRFFYDIKKELREGALKELNVPVVIKKGGMQNVRDVYSIEIENVFFLFSPQGEPIVTLEEKVESIYKQRRNKLKHFFESTIEKIVEPKFDPLPKNMTFKNVHLRIEDTTAEHPFAIGLVVEKCQLETSPHNTGVKGTRQKNIHLKGFRIYYHPDMKQPMNCNEGMNVFISDMMIPLTSSQSSHPLYPPKSLILPLNISVKMIFDLRDKRDIFLSELIDLASMLSKLDIHSEEGLKVVNLWMEMHTTTDLSKLTPDEAFTLLCKSLGKCHRLDLVSEFNKQAMSLQKKLNNPMLSITVNVENVSMEVSPELIRDLFSFYTQYLLHYNVEVYHQFKPNCRPDNKENCKLWWRYALKSIVYNLISREKIKSSFKTFDRILQKNRYIHLYQRKLSAPWLRILKGDMVAISHLEKLEREIDPQRVLYYREIAMKEIEEKKKMKFPPPPLPVKKKEPHELIDGVRKALYGLLLTRNKSKLMTYFDKYKPNDLPLKIRVYIPKVSLSLNKSVGDKLCDISANNIQVNVLARQLQMDISINVHDVKLLDFTPNAVFPTALDKKNEEGLDDDFLTVNVFFPLKGDDELKVNVNIVPILLSVNLDLFYNIIKTYSPKQDFEWTGVVDELQKGRNRIQLFVADFLADSITKDMTKEFNVQFDKILILLPFRYKRENVMFGLPIQKIILKSVPRRSRRSTSNIFESDVMDSRILYDDVSISIQSITGFLANINDNYDDINYINKEGLKVIEDFALNGCFSYCIRRSNPSLPASILTINVKPIMIIMNSKNFKNVDYFIHGCYLIVSKFTDYFAFGSTPSVDTMDDVESPAICLLCQKMFASLDAVKSHLWRRHNVDIKDTETMNYYSSTNKLKVPFVISKNFDRIYDDYKEYLQCSKTIINGTEDLAYIQQDVKMKIDINVQEVGFTLQSHVNNTDVIEFHIGPIQITGNQRTFDSTFEIAVKNMILIDKYRMKLLNSNNTPIYMIDPQYKASTYWLLSLCLTTVQFGSDLYESTKADISGVLRMETIQLSVHRDTLTILLQTITPLFTMTDLYKSNLSDFDGNNNNNNDNNNNKFFPFIPFLGNKIGIYDDPYRQKLNINLVWNGLVVLLKDENHQTVVDLTLSEFVFAILQLPLGLQINGFIQSAVINSKSLNGRTPLLTSKVSKDSLLTFDISFNQLIYHPDFHNQVCNVKMNCAGFNIIVSPQPFIDIYDFFLYPPLIDVIFVKSSSSISLDEIASPRSVTNSVTILIPDYDLSLILPGIDIQLKNIVILIPCDIESPEKFTIDIPLITISRLSSDNKIKLNVDNFNVVSTYIIPNEENKLMICTSTNENLMTITQELLHNVSIESYITLEKYLYITISISPLSVYLNPNQIELCYNITSTMLQYLPIFDNNNGKDEIVTHVEVPSELLPDIEDDNDNQPNKVNNLFLFSLPLILSVNIEHISLDLVDSLVNLVETKEKDEEFLKKVKLSLCLKNIDVNISINPHLLVTATVQSFMLKNSIFDTKLDDNNRYIINTISEEEDSFNLMPFFSFTYSMDLKDTTPIVNLSVSLQDMIINPTAVTVDLVSCICNIIISDVLKFLDIDLPLRRNGSDLSSPIRNRSMSFNNMNISTASGNNSSNGGNSGNNSIIQSSNTPSNRIIHRKLRSIDSLGSISTGSSFIINTQYITSSYVITTQPISNNLDLDTTTYNINVKVHHLTLSILDNPILPNSPSLVFQVNLNGNLNLNNTNTDVDLLLSKVLVYSSDSLLSIKPNKDNTLLSPCEIKANISAKLPSNMNVNIEAKKDINIRISSNYIQIIKDAISNLQIPIMIIRIKDLISKLPKSVLQLLNGNNNTNNKENNNNNTNNNNQSNNNVDNSPTMKITEILTGETMKFDIKIPLISCNIDSTNNTRTIMPCLNCNIYQFAVKKADSGFTTISLGVSASSYNKIVSAWEPVLDKEFFTTNIYLEHKKTYDTLNIKVNNEKDVDVTVTTALVKILMELIKDYTSEKQSMNVNIPVLELQNYCTETVKFMSEVNTSTSSSFTSLNNSKSDVQLLYCHYVLCRDSHNNVVHLVWLEIYNNRDMHLYLTIDKQNLLSNRQIGEYVINEEENSIEIIPLSSSTSINSGNSNNNKFIFYSITIDDFNKISAVLKQLDSNPLDSSIISTESANSSTSAQVNMKSPSQQQQQQPAKITSLSSLIASPSNTQSNSGNVTTTVKELKQYQSILLGRLFNPTESRNIQLYIGKSSFSVNPSRIGLTVHNVIINSQEQQIISEVKSTTKGKAIVLRSTFDIQNLLTINLTISAYTKKRQLLLTQELKPNDIMYIPLSCINEDGSYVVIKSSELGEVHRSIQYYMYLIPKEKANCDYSYEFSEVFVKGSEKFYTRGTLSHNIVTDIFNPKQTIIINSLKLSPYMIIENAIPEDINIILKNKDSSSSTDSMEYSIPKSGNQVVYSVADLAKNKYFVSIQCSKFSDSYSDTSPHSKIVPGNIKGKMSVTGRDGKSVYFSFSTYTLSSGTIILTVYFDLWIINHSGMTLWCSNQQTDSELNCISVLSKPTKISLPTSEIEPQYLIDNFDYFGFPTTSSHTSTSSSSSLASSKLFFSINKPFAKLWSNTYNSNSISVPTELSIQTTSGNRRDLIVTSKFAPSKFYNTKIIEISSKYYIWNYSDVPIVIRQVDTLESVVLDINESCPFYWSNPKGKLFLQCHPNDVNNEWYWSGSFGIDAMLYSIRLDSKNTDISPIYIELTSKIIDGKNILILKNCTKEDSTYMIINDCISYEAIVYQNNTTAYHKLIVPPMEREGFVFYSTVLPHDIMVILKPIDTLNLSKSNPTTTTTNSNTNSNNNENVNDMIYNKEIIQCILSFDKRNDKKITKKNNKQFIIMVDVIELHKAIHITCSELSVLQPYNIQMSKIIYDKMIIKRLNELTDYYRTYSRNIKMKCEALNKEKPSTPINENKCKFTVVKINNLLGINSSTLSGPYIIVISNGNKTVNYSIGLEKTYYFVDKELNIEDSGVLIISLYCHTVSSENEYFRKELNISKIECNKIIECDMLMDQIKKTISIISSSDNSGYGNNNSSNIIPNITLKFSFLRTSSIKQGHEQLELYTQRQNVSYLQELQHKIHSEIDNLKQLHIATKSGNINMVQRLSTKRSIRLSSGNSSGNNSGNNVLQMFQQNQQLMLNLTINNALFKNNDGSIIYTCLLDEYGNSYLTNSTPLNDNTNNSTSYNYSYRGVHTLKINTNCEGILVNKVDKTVYIYGIISESIKQDYPLLVPGTTIITINSKPTSDMTVNEIYDLFHSNGLELFINNDNVCVFGCEWNEVFTLPVESFDNNFTLVLFKECNGDGTPRESTSTMMRESNKIESSGKSPMVTPRSPNPTISTTTTSSSGTTTATAATTAIDITSPTADNNSASSSLNEPYVITVEGLNKPLNINNINKRNANDIFVGACEIHFDMNHLVSKEIINNNLEYINIEGIYDMKDLSFKDEEITIDLQLNHIGMTLIDQNPRELLYLSLFNIYSSFTLATDNNMMLSLRMSKYFIQDMTNPLSTLATPNVNNNSSTNGSNSLVLIHECPKTNVIDLNISGRDILSIDYIRLSIQKLIIVLPTQVLINLILFGLDLVDFKNDNNNNNTSNNNNNIVNLLLPYSGNIQISSPQSKGIVGIKSITISPIKMSLTITSGSQNIEDVLMKLQNNAKIAGGLRMLLGALSVVDDATINLNELNGYNIFDTPNNIGFKMIQHYKSEFFLQITKIFGQISLNLSGTVGLAVAVGKALMKKRIEYNCHMCRYFDHSGKVVCYSERDAIGGNIGKRLNINDDSYMWCTRVNNGNEILILFANEIIIIDNYTKNVKSRISFSNLNIIIEGSDLIKIKKEKVKFQNESFQKFFISLINEFSQKPIVSFENKWLMRNWIIENSPVESFSSNNNNNIISSELQPPPPPPSSTSTSSSFASSTSLPLPLSTNNNNSTLNSNQNNGEYMNNNNNNNNKSMLLNLVYDGNEIRKEKNRMLVKGNEYMVYRFKVTGKCDNRMCSWMVYKRWMSLVKFSSSISKYNKSVELSNKMSMSNFKKNIGFMKRTDDKIVNERVKQILYMTKVINETSSLKCLSEVINFFKENVDDSK